jgi:DNA-binding CsgD family transcriptional regulator
MSFKTAVCHRYRVMQKLKGHNVAGLVTYAIRSGAIAQ